MDKLNQVLLNEDIQVGADLDAWLSHGGGEGLAAALRRSGAGHPRSSRRPAFAAWAARDFRLTASGPPPRRARTR